MDAWKVLRGEKVKHGFAVYRCLRDNMVFLPIVIGPIWATRMNIQTLKVAVLALHRSDVTGPIEALTAAVVTESNSGG